MIRKIKSVKLITVIDGEEAASVIKLEALVGDGTEEDPCWILTQMWSLSGRMLLESCPPKN